MVPDRRGHKGFNGKYEATKYGGRMVCVLLGEADVSLVQRVARQSG